MNISKTVFFIFLLAASTLSSQIKFSNPSGSVNLTSSYYHISGDAEKRQQEVLTRAIMRLTFNIHPDIQLPFEIYLSSLQNRYQQPFNQIGVNPVISAWMILHGGYFSSRISDLTFGDLRILGGGVELKKWDFRLKFLYGLSRKAISPDPSAKFSGTYEQTMYAVSAGYGNEQSSYINLNLFHAKDDSSSITPLPDTLIRLAPNENIIGSVDFGVLISKLLIIKGEVAVSAFSNDLRVEEEDINLSVSPVLFTPKKSSQVDGAAKMTISLNPSRSWTLSLLGKWIGPGYNTLGYSWLQNDIFEISAGPVVRIMQNKIIIRGLIGYNKNNLRNNRESTTRRFNGRMNLYYQIFSNLGLDLQYINNRIRSYHTHDLIKVSNIFNNISITPNYSFKGIGGRNMVTINYSFQKASDGNPVLHQSVKNTFNIFNGIYTVYLPSSLTLSSNVLYNNITYELYSQRTFKVSETVTGNILSNRISFSLNFGYASSKTDVSDKQYLLNVLLSYRLSHYGTISLNVTNNNYNGFRVQNVANLYPDEYKFNELQATIQYNLNF